MPCWLSCQPSQGEEATKKNLIGVAQKAIILKIYLPKHQLFTEHINNTGVHRDITRLAPGCGDTRRLGGAGWHPDQEVGSCSCQADWSATQQAKTWKRWETLIQDPSRSRVWFTEKHVLMWINVSKQRFSSLIRQCCSSLLRCTLERINTFWVEIWDGLVQKVDQLEAGRLQPGLALEKFL